MKTPSRHFRIADKKWNEFQIYAQANNTTASDLLRDYINSCTSVTTSVDTHDITDVKDLIKVNEGFKEVIYKDKASVSKGLEIICHSDFPIIDLDTNKQLEEKTSIIRHKKEQYRASFSDMSPSKTLSIVDKIRQGNYHDKSIVEVIIGYCLKVDHPYKVNNIKFTLNNKLELINIS